MTITVASCSADLITAARRLPLVVARCVPPPVLARTQRRVNMIGVKEWQPGDGSAHSWIEHPLDADLIAQLSREIPLLGAISKYATAVVGWVNRFRQDEWIAAHRDAAGDLQCIVPLVVPDCAQGGQLWIQTRARLVPALPGDMLLFNAAALVHGTNAIMVENAERVTLNLRYWLREAPPLR